VEIGPDQRLVGASCGAADYDWQPAAVRAAASAFRARV